MRGIYANKFLAGNKIIKALTYTDFAVWSGSSLITTIFPLFVITQIQGATVTDAGISSMIFMVVPAIVNIPLGKYMDNNKGYVDEMYILVLSNILRGVTLIFLAFTTSLLWLHISQVVLGLARSMNTTSWRVLFSKFVDQKHLGSQWGIYDTIMAFGLGVSAFLGGFLGENLGFQIVMIVGGIMSLIGAIFPLLAKNNIEDIK